MEPIFAQSGRSSLATGGGVRLANARLQQACETMEPLELEGISFSWRMIHLATGLYRQGYGFDFHVHGRLQVESVLSGQFEFSDRSTSIVLDPGRSLFVLPRHAHAWECVKQGFMMGGLIKVEGPSQGEFLEAVREKRGGMAAVAPSTSSVWYRQLLALLSTSGMVVWRTASIVSLLDLLLVDLLKSLTDLSPWEPVAASRESTSDGRAGELCRRALEFLEANFAYPIQVKEVAMQTGVSPRHLTRIFRQAYGESVNNVLNQIRLRRAYQMLQDRPDLSIKEVAYATGFARPAYFTACFRKEYGVRPSELRQ